MMLHTQNLSIQIDPQVVRTLLEGLVLNVILR